MTDGPSPEDYRIPTIGELNEIRQERNLSMRQLSLRAGFEYHRFEQVKNNGGDPPASTLRAFLDALRETDPDGPRPQPGYQAIRSDGGPDEDAMTDQPKGAPGITRSGLGEEFVTRVGETDDEQEDRR